ncbi:NPL4-like protein [Hibiscus syriacus]|uniref:NPL4-like protein n=1 Tax=Hibiscus syriacus TaxID=106335 RepID=A0A6A3CK15_HIBSY|nr:NPL4-like protein 1 [Hibiscus syriacus]KAE8727608.1 NPL4-like protein [Hibiscus syriacus]
MLLRFRSRDGLERVQVGGPHISISQLRTLIHNQFLSTDRNLLLVKTPADLLRFSDMADPSAPLSALNLYHGSVVFLYYQGERNVRGGPAVTPAGSFGRKMTMDDLIAKQMRITRQESPHCDSVSFDRDSANAFQQYVNETLAFAVKRGGFMYGTVSEEGRVEVDFIYEPPQQGLEDDLILLRDQEEENMVDAIAAGLGRKRVGFIFTQTVMQGKKDYNFSNKEVIQAAELHAESGLKEWVTVVVKLEANEDGGADVHFEAFQMSDMCVKLFKEGWFVTKFGENDDPKLSKMKKAVVVGGKDVEEVDNDFFLVVVKIFDHQGPLLSTFPIENRNNLVTMRVLKNHLDRTRSVPFLKRISDFHLLLFLAMSQGLGSDIPALAECVSTQTPVLEGYQLLIESMANTA